MKKSPTSPSIVKNLKKEFAPVKMQERLETVKLPSIQATPLCLGQPEPL